MAAQRRPSDTSSEFTTAQQGGQLGRPAKNAVHTGHLKKAPTAPLKPTAAPSPGRDKLTVLVDTDLADRIRDAAWYLRLTVSEIAGLALERELARLERQQAGGKPFPKRGGAVKTGRPLKKRV